MDELNSNITNPIVGINTNVPVEEPIGKKIPVKRNRILHNAEAISVPKAKPAKEINTNTTGRQRILHSVDENPIVTDEEKPDLNAPVENVNDFTGNTMLADVDAEINKTVKELKTTNSEFGNMAREVIGLPSSKNQTTLRNHFLKLTEKKRNIERQMLKVPESLQKEAMPALSDPVLMKKMMENPEYTTNQITKAINIVIDNGLKAKEKIDNKILTSTGGISFSSLTDYVSTKDNNIFPDEIDRMYTELSKRPDYTIGDYKDKQAVIKKFVDNHFKEHEFSSPTAKEKQLNDYRHELSMKYAFAGEDESGAMQFTIEGLKMFVENERNVLLTYRNDLLNDLNELKAKDPEYANKLGTTRMALNTAFSFGKNPDAYLEYHYSQLNDIDEAVRGYDKVLSTAERKHGFKEFVPGVGRFGAEIIKGVGNKFSNAIDRNSLFTLGVSDIFKTLDMERLTKKELSGAQLSFVEKHKLQVAATLGQSTGWDNKSLGFEIGNAVTAMIPYIITYGLTQPVYKLGMEGTLKGLNAAGKKIIPAVAGKAITKTFDIAAKNIARLSGAELQNLANPQNLIPEVAGRMTPKISLKATLQLEDLKKGSELSTAVDVIDGSQQELGKALFQGSTVTMLDLWTERIGGPLERMLPKAGKAIGLTNEKISKMVLLRSLMKMKGIKEVSHGIKDITQWHRAGSEWFEELANQILAAPFQGGLGTPSEFIHQNLVTLGSILLFSPAMHGAQLIQEKTVGKNVKFNMTTKDSEVPNKEVFLPRPLYNQLMQVMGVDDTEGIDPEKLNNFIDFHKPDLNADQVNLILQLSYNLGEKKYAAQLIKDNPKLAEPEAKPLDKVHGETEKPGLAPNLVKQKQINEIESQRAGLLKIATTDAEKKSINKRIDKRIDDIKNALEHFQTKTRDLRTGKIKYVDMSPAEIAETKVENDRILIENADLFETGLLKYDPMSNQWVEPTSQMLIEDLDNVNKELQNYEGSKYEAAINNPSGFVPANAEESDSFQKYSQLIAQHEALKDKLVEVHNLGINFQDLAGEEKAHRLITEINENGKLEGIAQKTGTNRFGVKLSDGRLIHAALDIDLTPEEKKKAQSAISKGTQVILKNRPFEEFGPTMSQSWSDGTPLMSKVTAYTPDGIRLGSVLINSEPDKIRIREEKNKKVIADAKAKIEKVNTTVNKYVPTEKEQETIKWWNDLPIFNQTNPSYFNDKRSLVLKKLVKEGKLVRENLEGPEYESSIGNKYIYRPSDIKGPQLRSMILPGNINDAIAPDRHIDQDFFDALNDMTENLTIPIETFIPTLKSVIQSVAILPEIKQRYLDYIEKNKDQLKEQTLRIRASNMSQRTLAEKAAGKLNTAEVEMDDIETTFMSGEQKLDAQLNTFGKVWRHISASTGISKDKVERTFFRIANTPAWETVSNETTFEDFLTNLISIDTPTNAIVGSFKELGYGKAQSFFQFYRNVEMVAQVATLYSGGKIKFKILNTSDALQDFIEQAKFTLENYRYKTIDAGYKSVQFRLFNHKEETTKRFIDAPNKTNDELTELRKEQFIADKQLLQEITGIPVETWDTYFQDSKTKEMEAIIDPNNSRASKINFKTYDAYLSSQTYRYDKNGKSYPRWNSQLIYSLLDLTRSTENLADFTDAVDKFFFKGDEEKNTFSNLAKLATSSSTENNLGLSGQDVLRNRFSSLVQNNSIFYQLRHLDNIKTPLLNKSTQTTVDKSLSWGVLKNMPVYNKEGVNVMRKQNTNEHFGNPFTGTGVKNLIQMPNIKEAVDAYVQWLIGNPNDAIISEGKVVTLTDVKPEQRKWIISQIDEGKLDGKTFLYMKDKGMYFSHADALSEFVNKRHGIDNIVTGYQGSKEQNDNRKFNYFSQSALEAADYGKNVRKVTVDTTNFLHSGQLINGRYFRTKEYNEAQERFTDETGKRFEVLDNSPSGLKVQESFFRYLESIGYDGFTEIVTNNQDENAYFVTFNNKSEVKTGSVNNLLIWLKSDPKNLKYFFLNGISDTKGGNNTAQKMTTSDILISLFSDFLQKEDTYNQWTGQYGDKTQMLMLSVPKYTAEQLTNAKQDMADRGIDLQKTIDFVKYHTILRNGKFFEDHFGKVQNEAQKEKINDALESFVLNFTRNITDINEITRGNWSQYEEKGIVEFVKRGATSLSPYMSLDSNIEGGVGHSYKFASVIDEYLGIDKQFDGMTFFSDPWSKKLQVTLGEIYNKIDKYSRLSSAKLLHAGIDPSTSNEAITKANWLNIDMIADELGGKYAELRDFMHSQNLDIVSVRSSTKKHENGNEAHIKLWDDAGKVLGNIVIPDGGIVERRTDQLGFQQDLRHSAKGKLSKTPSAILSNILGLPHGSQILGHLQDIQDNELSDLTDLFNSEQSELVKIKWLKDNVNEQNQGHLLKLINAGLSIHDPSFKNVINNIVASAITKKVLEVSMLRVTSQEILDVDGVLKGRVASEATKGYIHLPEAMAAIEGGRESILDYIGKIDEAIAYVEANKKLFLDLYDSNEKLMDWIIRDKDGKIPGEPFVSVRVPTDDYRSFTVARLEKNLTSGNFTMLDRESQRASGSDADGDQRFNLLLSKQFYGKEKDNLALNNLIIMDLVYDYQNPINDIRIRSGINVKQFDKLIEKELGEVRSQYDIESYFKARSENIVGITMKGIFTDLLTTVNILQKYKIRMNNPVTFHDYTIDSIVNDRWGLIKLAMANVQNMSFDNVTQPRIEHLGFNEHASPMIFVLLMGNKALDTGTVDSPNFETREQHAAAIQIEVAKIKEIFTSDIAIDFRDYMREDMDALQQKNPKKMWEKLHSSYDSLYPGAVSEFKKLYEVGRDLDSIRKYFALSKEAPDSYAAFHVAENLHERISLRGLTHFNTRSFFTYADGEFTPIGVFKMIPKILNILKETVYVDSLDETPVGRFIHDKILARYTLRQKTESFGAMRIQDVAAISHSLNTIATIRSLESSIVSRAINFNLVREIIGKGPGISTIGNEENIISSIPNRTFRQVEKEVLESINTIRQNNPGNKFFTYTQKVETSSKEKILSPVSYGKKDFEGKPTSYISFEVDPQFHHAPITEVEMQSIRDDFDKLDDNTKDLLALYALYKWGPSMSRDRGSYMSFVGDQYHVMLSSLASIEQSKWAKEELTNREIYNILRWTTIASRSERVKPMNQYTDGLNDINAIPLNEMSGITQEAADELMEVKKIPKDNKTELRAFYNNWIKKYSIDAEDLRAAARKAYELTDEQAAPVVRFIEERNEAIKSDFLLTFPPKASPTQLKSMMPYSTISSILLTEDPELRDWTYSHLADVFPDVQFFRSRQRFYDFVEKHEGNLRDASPEAIGHAFKQAVFIDEKKAIQETVIHEYSHIYWDGLPDTNKAKHAMQKLYNETFAGTMSQADIDETIILDIGHAGSDISNISFRGSMIEKFKNVLKQFWIEVKKLFGQANRYDLIRDLAWDVWRNEENIHPSTNSGREEIRDMVDSPDSKTFDKIKHILTIRGRAVPGVTQIVHGNKNLAVDFRAISYGKQGLVNYRYKEESGKPRTQAIINTDADNLQKHWSDEGESGTRIHLIGQAVFNYDSLSEEDRKEYDNMENQFTPGVYKDTITMFEHMKDILITRYGPHIKFISEKQVISKKYMISGIADLIIDLGNDNKGNSQLVLIDFKTVNGPLATVEEGTDNIILEPDYTKSLGSFRKPFAKIAQSKQNEHKIQLNMYANMLEEYKNDSDNGNIVKEIIIFPITRKLDLNGKIIEATGTQSVSVKRDFDMADKMMSFDWEQRKPISDEGLKYVKVLETLHYKEDSILTMVKALSFFQSYTRNDIAGTTKYNKKGEVDPNGEVDPHGGLNWVVMDNMIDGSYSKLISNLYALGYENSDISGTKDTPGIPLEHLLYIAMTDHGITKQEYTDPDGLERNFPLLAVDTSYEWQENPNYSGNRYSHQIINGKDIYAREIGYGSDEIEKGTRVGLYINIQKEDGTFEKDFIQGAIEKVDQALHTITVITDEGNTVIRKTPDKDSGILELFEKDELPQTPEKLGIIPDTFEPKWLSILTEKKERHYRMLKDNAKEFKDNPQLSDLYKSDTKKIQKYIKEIEKINPNSPISALRKFLHDKDATINMYNKVSQMEENAAGLFSYFMESISASHKIADKVKTEYQYGANDLMHFMIDTYRYLTINDSVLFKKFSGSWLEGRGAEVVPSGEIEGGHIPFQLITSLVNDSENGLRAEEYRVKRLFAKLKGKFKFGNCITKNSAGDMYFIKPSKISEKDFPEIHEFLSAIYEYYYKYDPKYQGKGDENNYSLPIAIRKSFASKHELKTVYGMGKFSARFKEMMSSNEYDNIKVPLQEKVNGKWRDKQPKDDQGNLLTNQKGNPLPTRIMTLRDIKNQWSFENMSKAERIAFLGSKNDNGWKLPWKRFKVNAANSNSQLLRYYYLADQVMQTNGDKNNPTVFKQRKQLTARGTTQLLKYETQKYYENEESIIVSMISAYYKRELIAPWKMMTAKYQKILTPSVSSGVFKNLSDISRYLDKWGTFMIYDDKNPDASKSLEDFSKGIDWLNMWGSRSKIMGTVVTQKFNLLAGITSAVLKYPIQFGIGWSRIVMHPRKCINILKTYGVANFTDQLMMEKLDREWRWLGINWDPIESAGYSLVGFVEKVNQIGTYMGFMTKQEFGAYDSDGEVIETQKFNALSPTRQTSIANKLYKTQGHYGKTAMAPAWLGPEAKAALGLKRYIPGYIWALTLRHARINDLTDSGVLPSLFLLGKMLKHNLSSEARRKQDVLEAKLQKMRDEGIPDILLFERSAEDAFQNLLKESKTESGRIKWKQLSESDKTNLYMIIRAAGLYALITLVKSMVGGGDGDDEKKRTKIGNDVAQTLARFQNDIFMIQGPQSVVDQLTRLFTPLALAMILDSWKLMKSSIAMSEYLWTLEFGDVPMGKEKAFYQNAPNRYFPEGTPRILVDFLRVVPGGNAFTQVYKIGSDLRLHTRFIPESRFDKVHIDETMSELLKGDKKGLQKMFAEMVWNVFADKDVDSKVNEYDFKTASMKLLEKQKLIQDYKEYHHYDDGNGDQGTIDAINKAFRGKAANEELQKEGKMFANLRNAMDEINAFDMEGITKEMMIKDQKKLNALRMNSSIGTLNTKVKKQLQQNFVEISRDGKKGIRAYMKGTLKDIFSDVNQK